MKITMRDRIIALTSLLFILIYGCYQILWLPSCKKISALEKSKEEVRGLTADISPILRQSESLNTEKERLEKSVNEVKISGGKTLTKEEFLLYLGKYATERRVKLLGFNDFGTEENNGVYKAKFDFELQGNISNINKILSDIDKMGVKYTVGSMSLRQTTEYDYLKRFFDDKTKLPWYKEPEKQEELQEQQDDEPTNDMIVSPQTTLPEALPSSPPEAPSLQPTPVPAPIPDTSNSVPAEDAGDTIITDRLDDILEQKSFSGEYKAALLTNIQNSENPDFVVSDDMRLAVTICFLMFEKPDQSNSFMSQQSEEI